MKELIKVFNINPISASRPRVTRYAVFYSKAYEGFRKDFKRLLGHRMELTGAISATVSFDIAMPKSWTKKKKLELEGKPHTQKPDIDNFLKAVLDGMNGHYYEDDSQIAMIHSQKTWAKEGKITVILREMKV